MKAGPDFREEFNFDARGPIKPARPLSNQQVQMPSQSMEI